MTKSCVYLICLVLMLSSVLWAQRNRDAKHVVDARPRENPLPTTSIDFRDDGPVPGLLGSPVLVYPMKCAGDGTVFMQIPQPPDYLEKPLYAISAAAVRAYSVEKIPDLHDFRVLSYYPSDSGVTLLISATKAYREGKVSFVSPEGEKTEAVQNVGERRSYLAEFDRDGSFKRVFEADDSLAPTDVGVFGSGNFLVFGVARTNGLPLLAIFSADGTLLRLLDVPRATQEWSGKLRDPATVSAATLLRLPPSQLVPFNDTILVVPTGSTTVLEVGEGGAIRPVRLSLPAEFSIDSLIPSNGHWYVRVRGSGADNKEPGNGQPFLVYELRPTDGAAVRRIETRPVPTATISCVYDQQFIAFRYDNGKFVRMHGYIKP